MASSELGRAVASTFGNNTGQFLANAVYNGHIELAMMRTGRAL